MVPPKREKLPNEVQFLNLLHSSPRYRFGSGKSCSQLTVEELSSFVRQLYNLPCSLPQAPMLKVGWWGMMHAGISLNVLHCITVLSDKKSNLVYD